MKHLIILISTLTLTNPSCFSQSETQSNDFTIEESLTPQEDLGWPKEIEGLVEHLNGWDKEELDVYEQANKYPNRISSGETNGWINEHKRQLKELGAIVFWNKKKMQYELRKK